MTIFEPLSRRRLLLDAASASLLSAIGASAPSKAWAGTAPSPMPFAVGVVDDALGRSILYEEYKGNYAVAQRQAEQTLRAVRRGSDPVALADALRARGVVALLQGDASRALELFRELEGQVSGDASKRLWTAAYQIAAFLQSVTVPGGIQGQGDEIERRHAVSPGHLGSTRYLMEHLGAIDAAKGLPSWAAGRFMWTKYMVLPLLRDGATTMLQLGKSPERLKIEADVSLMVRDDTAALGDAGVTAFVAAAQADAARRSGDMARAKDLMRQARALYDTANDSAGVVATHILEGDWSAAPLTTPEAMNYIVQGNPNSRGDPDIQVELLETTRASANAEDAEMAYARAERLGAGLGMPRAAAAIKLRRAYLAGLKGDYGGAIQHARMAAGEFQAAGDHLGYWCARMHGALAQIGGGNVAEDRETARALGEWGAREGAFGHALGLGLVCQRAGYYWATQSSDYERALACLRLSESLFDALGARINRAQAVVDQGRIYAAVGQANAAITTLQRAFDLFAAVNYQGPLLANGDLSRMNEVSLSLFNAYLDQHDADGMERAAARAAALSERILQLAVNPDAERSNSKMQLAVQQAKALLSLASDVPVLAPTLRALQARKAGDGAAAERNFELALSRAREVKGRQASAFLQALVSRSRKQYPHAAQAIEIYVDDMAAHGHPGLAEMMEQFKRIAPERAQDLMKRQRFQAYEVGMGFLASIDAFDAAQRQLDSLEALAGKNWWSAEGDGWKQLGSIGLIHEGLGRWAQAADCYDQAILLVENQRGRLRSDEMKTALASSGGPQQIYFRAARNAMRAADAAGGATSLRGAALVAQGFDYAERAKARGLLDLMAGGAGWAGPVAGPVRDWRQSSARLDTWRGLLAAELAHSPPDASRMADLTTRITTEEARLREMESGLAANMPGFRDATNPKATMLGVAQVASALPPGTVLLQYLFLGDDLLAWAVSADGVVASRNSKVDVEALERDIRGFHQQCERRGDIEPLGGRLAQALLEPFSNVLDRYRDLIIVPYGAAHLLPFQALPWREGPLAATHNIAYLPSASMLQYVRGAGDRKVPDGVLTIGNPFAMAYHPPLGLPPVPQPALPAAGIEAVQIAKLFPNGRALVGVDATAAALRSAMPHYRLLHFATHGHLDDKSPMLSAILLANGESLTVAEFLGLRLDAELVVLSACRTGQGKENSGDDVVGLARSLLASGARAAVVSLWPVDDVATSVLMKTFYEGLRAGLPPALALRDAQRSLRSMDAKAVQDARASLGHNLPRGTVVSTDQRAGADDYSHPYYWAAFVFIG